MHDEDDLTTDVDTPRLSILGQMRARREEIAEGEILALPVPRWTDPVVVVKYKPIPHPVIRSIQQRVEKTPKNKQATAELDGNCDLLIRGCTAVVARIDGQEYSLRPGDPKGEPTMFDADLAANLGLDEDASARQVVKALFFTDGDIISAAGELTKFSGYRTTDADEVFEGE